jgi:hypothetical protein
MGRRQVFAVSGSPFTERKAALQSVTVLWSGTVLRSGAVLRSGPIEQGGSGVLGNLLVRYRVRVLRDAGSVVSVGWASEQKLSGHFRSRIVGTSATALGGPASWLRPWGSG